MAEFTVRRYDGDDMYSWAVFRTADVKRFGPAGTQLFYGDARPYAEGLGRQAALRTAKELNERNRA